MTAGLPNITGQFSALTDRHTASGSFTYGSTSGGSFEGGGGREYWIYFNASHSNSIYGASMTVQPPAIALLPQIKL